MSSENVEGAATQERQALSSSRNLPTLRDSSLSAMASLSLPASGGGGKGKVTTGGTTSAHASVSPDGHHLGGHLHTGVGGLHHQLADAPNATASSSLVKIKSMAAQGVQEPTLSQPADWHYKELLELPMFAAMPRVAFDLLVAEMKIVDYEPGAEIFEQGTELDRKSCFYVVVKGSVDIYAHLERRRGNAVDKRVEELAEAVDSAANESDNKGGRIKRLLSSSSNLGRDRESKSRGEKKRKGKHSTPVNANDDERLEKASENSSETQENVPHLPYLVQLRRNSLEIRRLSLTVLPTQPSFARHEELFMEVKFEESNHHLGSLITTVNSSASFGEDALLARDGANVGGISLRSTSAVTGTSGVRLATLTASKYVAFVKRVGRFFFAPLQCAAIASLQHARRKTHEIALLAENCLSLSFFQALKHSVLLRVCEHIEYYQVRSGTLLFREGEQPGSRALFYILKSGHVMMYAGHPIRADRVDQAHHEGHEQMAVPLQHRITNYGAEVGGILPGESFGEKCMKRTNKNAPRTATGVCSTDCELFVLRMSSFQLLENALEDALGSAEAMQVALRKPVEHREKADIDLLIQKTKDIDFFKTLSSTVFREVCRHARLKSLSSGSVIFSEGAPGDSFYIILLGSVSLHVKEVGKMESFESQLAGGAAHGQCVQILFRGQAFGEYALMRKDNRRSASAIALTDVHLMVISKDDFNDILEDAVSKEEQNEKARFLVQYIPGLQDAYSRAISLSYGLVERSFRRNDIILREGEPGKNCFLVKEGLVQLSINRYVMQQRQGRNHPTSPRQQSFSPPRSPIRITLPLTQLGVGSICGEFALLFQKTQPYDVTATGFRCTLYEMPRDVLLDLPTASLAVVREESHYRNEKWSSRLKDILAKNPMVFERGPRISNESVGSGTAKYESETLHKEPSASFSVQSQHKLQSELSLRSLDDEVRRIALLRPTSPNGIGGNHSPESKRGDQLPEVRSRSKSRSKSQANDIVYDSSPPLYRSESAFACITNESLVNFQKVFRPIMSKSMGRLPQYIPSNPYWPRPHSYATDEPPREYVRNAIAHTVDSNAVATEHMRKMRLQLGKDLSRIDKEYGVDREEDQRYIDEAIKIPDDLWDRVRALEDGGPNTTVTAIKKKLHTKDEMRRHGLREEDLEEPSEIERIREKRRQRHIPPGPKLNVKVARELAFSDAAYKKAVERRMRKELEKHKGRDKTASFAKLRDRLEVTTSVALEPERVELFVDEEEWARTHSNTKAIDDLCKPSASAIHVTSEVRSERLNEGAIKSLGRGVAASLRALTNNSRRVRESIKMFDD